jgi:hypothetical protein
VRKLGWISHDIRIPSKAVTARGVRVGTVAHDWSKGLATLDDERAGELPASDDLIEQQAIVHELPPATKGQLINDIPFDGISNIEVRTAVVCGRIIGVLPVRVAGMASPARSVEIVQEV